MVVSRQRITNEDGQTSVEYALVLALIAVVLAVAFGAAVSGVLDGIPGRVAAAF